MSAAKLYTHDVLALATSLGQWPLVPAMPLTGQARSPTCGSIVTLSMETDGAGKITALGIQAQACAIGQASAALFAASADGRSVEEVTSALAGLKDWLNGDAGLPDWPGVETIEPARGYPARHGAILLPWQAARDALSSTAKLG